MKLWGYMTNRLFVLLLLLPGCAVSQPRGFGEERYTRVDGTNYTYWIYTPEGHDPLEKSPLVVSLHGINPFDSAHGQCREWQQEADRYGLVIIAPELHASKLFAPSNPSTVTWDMDRDREAIVAILDDLSYECWFDPDAVLMTSWSYGGYIAHWVVNQHPELFTCLAVRQSNFNADLLDMDQLPKYRFHKVGIFTTKNDFILTR